MRRLLLPLLLIAILAVYGLPVVKTVAAPVRPAPAVLASYQIPDWMSLETASRLAVGIDVYVPPYIPAPFGEAPTVQASDGYYSLYWQIPGAPPTFLRVTGESGGSIPDFSYYDRNIQLTQNATVLGYPAYHDVSPIYDVVYWKMGNVVYTVESHNLVADDSLSLANMLMYVSPPATSGGNAERVFTLGVPESVQSGEVAGIGVYGDGDVLLTAEDGLFSATGENTVVVTGGSTVDWEAPYYESDAALAFYVYDLDSGDELASATTLLEGYLSAGETVSADIQCPSEASAGKLARVIVTGNGTISILANDGSFPAESPNINFQPDAEGGQILIGTLPDESTVSLSWLAPETAGASSISVSDLDDNVLDECQIDVASGAGSGDLGGPENGLVSGDGTGLVDVDRSIVLRAIANPTGFAGDASGGPEAYGPDYGMESLVAQNLLDGSGNVASPEDENAANDAGDDAQFGPASGAGNMVAIGMGRNGGRLENPVGATIVVPPGAFTDQTTVMIKPVPDHELPQVGSIQLLPGTAYDVSFSEADGRAAKPLDAPATLTIKLNNVTGSEGARIYSIEGATIKPMPDFASDGETVTTEVTALSRYVVGVPAPVVAGTTRPFNPLIVGLLALIALLSAGLLISRGLQRRKTRVIPVRRPAPSRVRYR